VKRDEPALDFGQELRGDFGLVAGREIRQDLSLRKRTLTRALKAFFCRFCRINKEEKI